MALPIRPFSPAIEQITHCRWESHDFNALPFTLISLSSVNISTVAFSARYAVPVTKRHKLDFLQHAQR